MSRERIFIHIPKTGGTTLNCAINGTDWQTTPNFNYRHIIYDTKLSNSGDIFKPENVEKYKACDIFTILRDPVDRLISEYYFLRDRKEFMSLFKKQPRSLEQYAKNTQTQNYMTSFFLGSRIYSTKAIGEAELEKVIHYIEELPIHVGIFEEYEKSLEYLATKMKFKWPKKIEVKRITLNRPPLDEVTDEVKAIIKAANPLDVKLYEYCKAKIDATDIQARNVEFQKDKYGYIMKYTQRFVLFELFEVEKTYLAANNSFFRNLNKTLHDQVDGNNGRSYVMSWNKNVTIAMRKIDPTFGTSTLTIEMATDDPLGYTKQMAKDLKVQMIKDKSFKRKLLKLDKSDIKIEKYDTPKKSFMNRIFGS